MGFSIYTPDYLSPSLERRCLRVYNARRYYKFCLGYHRLVSIYYSILGLESDDEE